MSGVAPEWEIFEIIQGSAPGFSLPLVGQGPHLQCSLCPAMRVKRRGIVNKMWRVGDKDNVYGQGSCPGSKGGGGRDLVKMYS